MNDPIEVTTRFATTVDELSDAWAFVMEHLEKVGDDPEIKISPVFILSIADMDRESYDEEAPWPRRFSVVVKGMVS